MGITAESISVLISWFLKIENSSSEKFSKNFKILFLRYRYMNKRLPDFLFQTAFVIS